MVELHWFKETCYNQKILLTTENWMLCHALGGVVIFVSLQIFIAPAMDSRREVKFTSFAWNLTSSAWMWYYFSVGKYSVLENFSGRNTFSKVVALLYKRAELDLRLTNTFWTVQISSLNQVLMPPQIHQYKMIQNSQVYNFFCKLSC